MKRILFTRLSPGSHKNAKRWDWRYGEEEDGRWHGDEEEESRQAAIIRRNWHRCSRWDADLIYLSRLSGILILVRGRAFSNDASSAPSSSPLSLSPRRSSGQLVFVDRPRRGENCLRIGCISLGFRGSCSPFSSAPLFFSSSLSPREEGSQRGRYKSDTPIQPSVFVSHITFFFAAYFFKLKILSFFSWMILANRFSRLIFFFFFFLNRNNLHPNSFRWQRLIGFFLNRSSFEL